MPPFASPPPSPRLGRLGSQNLCLEIKASQLAPSASAFLAKAPEPPPPDAVEAALVTLLDAGAIEPTGVGAAAAAGGGDQQQAWVKSDPWSLLKLLRSPSPTGSGAKVLDDTALTLTPLGRHLARLPVDVKLAKVRARPRATGCV